jgi:hypothetical protein
MQFPPRTDSQKTGKAIPQEVLLAAVNAMGADFSDPGREPGSGCTSHKTNRLPPGMTQKELGSQRKPAFT